MFTFNTSRFRARTLQNCRSWTPWSISVGTHVRCPCDTDLFIFVTEPAGSIGALYQKS